MGEGGEDRVTSMGQSHRARAWGGNPDYRQVVTKHFVSAPPGGYWSPTGSGREE